MITLSKRQKSAAPFDPVRGLGYRADIDGLRGIAILLVLLFHAGVPWVKGGYSGVDIFFVISGYLIGFQVSSELTQERFDLGQFYEKRLRRLLPALLVVLLLTLLAAWILFDGRELRALGEQTGAATASVSNVYFWATTNYFSPNAHLQTLLMTWSLGIEVQFYLVLPLMAISFHRWAHSWFLGMMVLSVVLSLGFATLAMHYGWPGGFFLITARWWELAAGVVLGTVEVRAKHSNLMVDGPVAEAYGALGLIGLVASAALQEPRAELLFPPACISVAAAVLLCMSPTSWVNRNILAFKGLLALGRRSYSVYLWHWPLLSLGYLCGASYLAPRGRVTLLALTFLFAEMSYRYVELPFRRPRSKVKAMRIVTGMGAAALVVSAAFVFTHGWPSRRPVASQIENLARGNTLIRMCLVEESGSAETIPTACVPPNATVALIGDSHAAALASAVREASPSTQMLMKSSCPPLLGVTLRGSGPDRCSAFESKSLARLSAEKEVRTVLVAGFWLNPFYDPEHATRYVTASNYYASTTKEKSWTNLQDGLLALCLALRTAGKDVVLIEDVPIMLYDPHLLAVGNTIPIRTRLGRELASAPSWSEREPHPRTPDEMRMHAILQDVATRSSSEVVSLYQPLCDDLSCKVIDGGMPLFEDRQHLSTLGAQLLLRLSGLAQILQHSSDAAASSKPESPR